jgi:Arc/MetJ family transcription regulator
MHIQTIFLHKEAEILMRTTLDIDAKLLEDAVAVTGARSKKEAVHIALEQLLRARRREELCRLIGSYDGFTLSIKKLEKMRNDA